MDDDGSKAAFVMKDEEGLAEGDSAWADDRVRVLCYGDSLTAGYTGTRPTKYIPYSRTLSDGLGSGVAVDYVGLSGLTAQQLLGAVNQAEIHDAFDVIGAGLRVALASASYSAVLIQAGTNDLADSTSEEILNWLKKLHEVCHEADVHTVALPIPHSNACTWLEAIGGKRTEINKSLHDYAESCDAVSVIDITEEFLYERGTDLFADDGLHLSVKGYELFGEKLVAPVRDVLEGLSSTKK